MYEVKHDIKVYQIDITFYEFKELSNNNEIVDYIVKEHRTFLNPELGDEILDLPSLQEDDILYKIYVYNTVEKESTWKEFLPPKISSKGVGNK